MPIQASQWTDFLSCPVCYNPFNAETRGPVTLGCGHSICRGCLTNLHRKQCPFDQTQIRLDVLKIPLNAALVRLVGGVPRDEDIDPFLLPANNVAYYCKASRCIQDLALYLKPFSSGTVSVLSKPMQRKLVTLANCQLLVAEGRARALRAARSLGERAVTELLLQHQDPQLLSANLWTAVRAKGCQFLGPAMQEEVLKLILLALEDGSALSRKVLIMFVVQRLEPHYSQASKTSIGHVVQLLFRASCYKVSQREGDSSLMQLKEEFRTYEALRREHDAQIVQIAIEAGLKIPPDQWSSLLYGDTSHKSHMQSIMDKLQTPQSFSQSVQELVIALQRSGDPGNLSNLRTHWELLASIDPSPNSPPPSWEETANVLEAARLVVRGLADFISQHGNRRQQDATYSSNKYKSNACRDLAPRGQGSSRSNNYSYGHSDGDTGDKFRGGRGRKVHNPEPSISRDANALPAVIQAPPSPSLYDAEQYTTTSSSNIYVTVPNFNLRNGVPAYPYWVAPEKNINLHHPNNLSRLRLGKPEIILVPGGTPMSEQEEYTPFKPNRMNKFGPVCRQIQNFHNVGYDESTAWNAEAARKVRMVQPIWPQIPVLSVNDAESHYINQQPPSFVTESQRVKQQLRNLEKKILDLKLSYMEETHQGQIVDELRGIQGLRDEAIYEAGIMEDMKELEQRWDSELAEQERRWIETDARLLN